MKTHVKQLETFLSKYGLTAAFILNMKRYGRRPQIKTIEDLVAFLHKNRHPIRQAFFLAFYWDGGDKKDGVAYWKMWSNLWRKELDK